MTKTSTINEASSTATKAVPTSRIEVLIKGEEWRGSFIVEAITDSSHGGRTEIVDAYDAARKVLVDGSSLKGTDSRNSRRLSKFRSAASSRFAASWLAAMVA